MACKVGPPWTNAMLLDVRSLSECSYISGITYQNVTTASVLNRKSFKKHAASPITSVYRVYPRQLRPRR